MFMAYIPFGAHSTVFDDFQTIQIRCFKLCDLIDSLMHSLVLLKHECTLAPKCTQVQM